MRSRIQTIVMEGLTVGILALGAQYHISFGPAGRNEYSLSSGTKKLHSKVADNSFLLGVLISSGFV